MSKLKGVPQINQYVVDYIEVSVDDTQPIYQPNHPFDIDFDYVASQYPKDDKDMYYEPATKSVFLVAPRKRSDLKTPVYKIALDVQLEQGDARIGDYIKYEIVSRIDGVQTTLASLDTEAKYEMDPPIAPDSILKGYAFRMIRLNAFIDGRDYLNQDIRIACVVTIGQTAHAVEIEPKTIKRANMIVRQYLDDSTPAVEGRGAFFGILPSTYKIPKGLNYVNVMQQEKTGFTKKQDAFLQMQSGSGNFFPRKELTEVDVKLRVDIDYAGGVSVPDNPRRPMLSVLIQTYAPWVIESKTQGKGGPYGSYDNPEEVTLESWIAGRRFEVYAPHNPTELVYESSGDPTTFQGSMSVVRKVHPSGYLSILVRGSQLVDTALDYFNVVITDVSTKET